jgi:hypothetical protein
VNTNNLTAASSAPGIMDVEAVWALQRWLHVFTTAGAPVVSPALMNKFAESYQYGGIPQTADGTVAHCRRVSRRCRREPQTSPTRTQGVKC